MPNCLVQSLRLTNHTQPQTGPIYYTLFWRCTSVLHLLPAPANYTNLVQKNQFPELNQHILTFLQQILQYGVTCWALVEVLSPLDLNAALHLPDNMISLAHCFFKCVTNLDLVQCLTIIFWCTPSYHKWNCGEYMYCVQMWSSPNSMFLHNWWLYCQKTGEHVLNYYVLSIY